MEQSVNYIDQGILHLEEAEFEAAIESFQKAQRLGLGDQSELHVLLGEAHAHLQNWDSALEMFNIALHHNPYNPDAYNERGNLRRFLGDYEGAIEDQTAAIQIQPRSHIAYYNRGLAHEKLGNLQQAELDLTHCLQLKPDTVIAYETRARLRKELFNFNGAIDDLKTYLELGGGKENDNQGDTQSELIMLRLERLLRRVLGMPVGAVEELDVAES